jgi:AraC-like DNA-binding protein
MLMAGDRLRSTSDTVSSIALSLGYESESAFSTALKKVMASSPSHYRRESPAR